jgi:hypothetical protein
MEMRRHHSGTTTKKKNTARSSAGVIKCGRRDDVECSTACASAACRNSFGKDALGRRTLIVRDLERGMLPSLKQAANDKQQVWITVRSRNDSAHYAGRSGHDGVGERGKVWRVPGDCNNTAAGLHAAGKIGHTLVSKVPVRDNDDGSAASSPQKGFLSEADVKAKRQLDDW